ncbi:MAG: hypothetical protein VX874_23865 [Pseudomonadota bacterium]|nr:hypothetical protein [Pseudomonadota bacterium]
MSKLKSIWLRASNLVTAPARRVKVLLTGRTRYDPARHYMRGPGPATERHASCGETDRG